MRISPHPRCAYIPPLSFTVADVPLAQKDKDVTCRYYAVHAGVLDRLTDDPQPTCVNHVSCRSDSEQFGVSKPRPLFIEQRTRQSGLITSAKCQKATSLHHQAGCKHVSRRSVGEACFEQTVIRERPRWTEETKGTNILRPLPEGA